MTKKSINQKRSDTSRRNFIKNSAITGKVGVWEFEKPNCVVILINFFRSDYLKL